MDIFTSHIVKKIDNTLNPDKRFTEKKLHRYRPQVLRDCSAKGMESVVESGTAAGSKIKRHNSVW